VGAGRGVDGVGLGGVTGGAHGPLRTKTMLESRQFALFRRHSLP
jgi:hypothetical protein